MSIGGGVSNSDEVLQETQVEASRQDGEVPAEDATAFIAEQRQKGWLDFHPEDYCHRCGRPNIPSWWVDSEEWNRAALPHDILCPQCFVAAWTAVTGLTVSWELRLDPSTLPGGEES